MRRLRARRDEGSASLELVGLLPVLVLMVCALLYGGSVVYTVHAANQAVRDGARALSLGQPALPAVERSLPGSVQVDRLTYPPGGGVRLQVRTAELAFFPRLTVTREAVMPRTVS